MLVVRNVYLEHRVTSLLGYLDISLLAGVRLNRIDPTGIIKANHPSRAAGRIRVGELTMTMVLAAEQGWFPSLYRIPVCRHLLQGLIASLLGPAATLADRTSICQPTATKPATRRMQVLKASPTHPTPLQEPAQVLARASTAICFCALSQYPHSQHAFPPTPPRLLGVLVPAVL